MSGYGIQLYPDGKMYKGQFTDNEKHGYGVYMWPNNREYEGWWSRGK